uniref:GGDEF domain-containing protein n=1 Tax=Thalassobaculum salexigens TaxID=455360 RepID=UPI00248E1720
NMKLDWSSKGRARVYAFTVLGTLVCIGFAFVFDGYSFKDGTWRWGSDPINNLLIPLILAPPLLFFILSKMRQLSIAHEELMTVAATDSLTSLLNRRAFTEMVDGYLNRVEDAAASHNALFVIDVDHFKLVNDTYGHGAGDRVLQHITELMRSSVRNVDLVSRLGGEEFVVVMPDTPEPFAMVVAERLRDVIASTPLRLDDGRELGVTISIGCALRNSVGEDSIDKLIGRADDALYQAKRQGRDRVVLATDESAANVTAVS